MELNICSVCVFSLWRRRGQLRGSGGGFAQGAPTPVWWGGNPFSSLLFDRCEGLNFILQRKRRGKVVHVRFGGRGGIPVGVPGLHAPISPWTKKRRKEIPPWLFTLGLYLSCVLLFARRIPRGSVPLHQSSGSAIGWSACQGHQGHQGLL